MSLSAPQRPHEEVPLDETFDAIVVSGVIGDLTDVEAFFASLRRLATPRTRLFRRDYELMKRQREVLARADPFGDFFLLFGAAKQMLRIIEVPIRYRSRRYGDTKTRLVWHGLLLPRTWWAGVRLFKLAS